MKPEELIKLVPVKKREFWQKHNLALLWLRKESINLCAPPDFLCHIVGDYGFLALRVDDLLLFLLSARADESPDEFFHRTLGGPKLAEALHSEPEIYQATALQELLKKG